METKIPTHLRLCHLLPSPYELAVLSKHAYSRELTEKEQIEVTINNDRIELAGWYLYAIITPKKSSWKKLLSYLGFSNGYKAIVYANDEKKQLVLAYRGFDSQNIGRLQTLHDMTQVCAGGKKMSLAEVKEKFLDIADKKKSYSLTTTGHSSGGWLAQITTFLIYNEESEYRCPAVVFDSFSARSLLKEMKTKDLNDYLPITSYLSSPNSVNCFDEPMGSAYRVVFPSLAAVENTKRYTLASHKIEHFIQAFKKEGEAKECHHVETWPLASISIEITKLIGQFIQSTWFEKLFKLCKIFKKILAGEGLLGSYSDYFHFEKLLAKHDYDIKAIKEPEKVHELLYGCQYDTKKILDSQHQRIHKRHLSQKARRVLEETYTREKYSKTLKDLGLDALSEATEEKDYIIIEQKGRDIRCLVDHLEAFIVDKDLTELVGKHYTKIKDIPEPTDPLMGRSGEIEQIKKALDLKTHRATCFLIGQPGEGKTHLAHHYAYHYTEAYSHIYWLNADSKQTLFTSYRDMAIYLKLQLSRKISNRQLVKTISRELSKEEGRYLLIYDNADNPKDLKDNIPNVDAHILITSRKRQESWDGLYQGTFIDVNPLAPSVAEKLLVGVEKYVKQVKSTEKGKTEEEKKAIQTLCKKVGYSPLALMLIVGYMRKKNVDRLFTYVEYLQKFQTNELALLKEGESKNSQNLRKSIAATWMLSLDSMREENPHIGENIYHFAFIAPDNIPYNLVKALLCYCKENDICDDLLLLLIDHSLLKVQATKSYGIHRLLQQVIHSELEQKQQWNDALNHVLYIIREEWSDKFYPIDSETFREPAEPLVPHVMKVVSYIQDSKFFFGPIDHLRYLYLTLEFASYQLNIAHQYQKVIQLLEPIVKAEKNIVDNSTYNKEFAQEDKSNWHSYPKSLLDTLLINTYINLSDAYNRKGKFKTANTYLRKACNRNEKDSNSFQQKVLIYNKLGNNFYYQDNDDEAIAYYEKALSIVKKRKMFKRGRGILYTNLGRVYTRKRDFNKAWFFFQKAFSAHGKSYGALDRKLLNLYHHISYMHDLQGNPGKAIGARDKAAAIQLKWFGYEQVYLAYLYHDIAVLYARVNHKEKVITLLTKAITILEKHLPYDANLVDMKLFLNMMQSDNCKKEPLEIAEMLKKTHLEKIFDILL